MVNVDRRHRAFRGSYDCELRVRSNVAGRIHSLDTSLPRVINPHETRFFVQTTPECFMKVSSDLRAEVEEQRVAFKWITIGKDDALQLPR